MLGIRNLGRRLIEGVVGLFAVLGFLYVPLGRHTGFEHAQAVFSTPAASAALDDLTTTVLGLRQRALDFITGRLAAPTAPPEPTGPETPQTDVAGRGPRAVPPKLK